ncbi:hypothetical protein GF337_05010 [candidate division KSB1 bacterium]|nr:hypothetical protein [candidate division KSB1 bacterium]
MKRITIASFIFMALVYLFPIYSVSGQEKQVDRLVVPLSDPNERCTVDVGLVNGGISVTGYDGKDVIVEAKTRMKQLDPQDSKKSKGMIRIPVTTTGLTVEEEDNYVDVSVHSWKRTIDVTLKVPHKSSLELSCVNHGDIYVEDVTGEFDINNINGSVTLKDISGAVVAHALNKDLIVTMKKVDSDKNMSFSTLNGDVDVTFPKNVKAEVQLNTTNGEIFSDFEVKISDKPKRIISDNEDGNKGKYRVEIDRTIYGEINGGGAEMIFKSFNGNIYIRKQN